MPEMLLAEIACDTMPAHQLDNNFAFIDSQNLNLGVQSLGWKLDFTKFRRYLEEKYRVTVAYLFIGYVPANRDLYASLQKMGYVLVFKPTIPGADGKVKGNIDADLVLQAMIDYVKYAQAIVITSDGDFASLVKYLHANGKLKCVMSPYVKTCSALLKKAAQERIVFMDNLKQKLEFERK